MVAAEEAAGAAQARLSRGHEAVSGVGVANVAKVRRNLVEGGGHLHTAIAALVLGKILAGGQVIRRARGFSKCAICFGCEALRIDHGTDDRIDHG